MDARSSDSAADRWLSVTRLAASLAPALPDGPAAALLLPLCFVVAQHLRFDAADPLWPDRDRLLVDAGMTGLGETLAGLAGLPERAFFAHGPALGLGAGQALAERLLAARFGRSLVDHRSWVIAAAEDLPTGAVQEVAGLAGAWRLCRLIALTGVAAADAPGIAGFSAAGWSVRRVDAGNPASVAAALSAAQRSQRPTLIACIDAGQKAPASPAGTAREENLQAWRAAGKRSAGVRRGWLKRLARHGSRQDFETATAGRLPHGWYAAYVESGPLLPPGQTEVSTSWTLRRTIGRLAAGVPEVTRLPTDACAKAAGGISEPLSGRQGELVLAQGLSAIATGAALHGGVVPVQKHVLAACDGVAAGLRAAALSGLRTLTLLIEPDAGCLAGGQLAALRAMRNLCVFRPADASEALECADLALRRTAGPTVLLAADAPVALLADRPSRTRCAKGGYVLAEAAAPRAATLIASGPELHLAVAARTMLAAADTPVAVVSLPCWDVFARQDPAWHEAVLGDAPRIGLEAGTGFGWERWLGQEGLFVGLHHRDDLAWDARRPHASADRLVYIILRHLGRRYPV